jgi:ribosomal protein L29
VNSNIQNYEKDEKDASIEELNGKLLQQKKELNDLKISHSMVSKELEQMQKEC